MPRPIWPVPTIAMRRVTCGLLPEWGVLWDCSVPDGERVALLAGKIDHHILGRQEFVEPGLAALAAEAAFLHAAERSLGRDHAVGVDPDDAAAQLRDRPHRPRQVAGPDARGEAER